MNQPELQQRQLAQVLHATELLAVVRQPPLQRQQPAHETGLGVALTSWVAGLAAVAGFVCVVGQGLALLPQSCSGPSSYERWSLQGPWLAAH